MFPSDWQPVAHHRAPSKRAEAEGHEPAAPGRPGIKRVTAYVTVEEWRLFKMLCASGGRTMSDVLSDLVLTWLRKESEESGVRPAKDRSKR